jgi:hypothetical protein
MRTLTPFKDAKYLPLEKALEQLKAYQPPAQSPKVISAGTGIEDLENVFRFHDINYNGILYTVDWQKSLLWEGARFTPEIWHTRARAGKYNIPSLRMYNTIITAAYNARDHPEFGGEANAFRQNLYQQLSGDDELITSTVIDRHKRIEGNLVIHDYGTDSPRHNYFPAICKNRYMPELDSHSSKVLFGAEKEQVIEAWQWLMNGRLYLQFETEQTRYTLSIRNRISVPSIYVASPEMPMPANAISIIAQP